MGVGMCVFGPICHLTHWNHKRKVAMDSSQYGVHFKLESTKMLHLKMMVQFANFEQVWCPSAVFSTKYASMIILKPITMFSLHRQQVCGRSMQFVGTDS